jgi:hypothetical protein
MPDWRAVLSEIKDCALKQVAPIDFVRRKYLRQLSDLTGRNVISYYSGWLQKPDLQGIDLTDNDTHGFMVAIEPLDRKKGLDILLHTPGGSMAATEAIVDYLHREFNNDIRAVVPQLAMSAGTMIACACREIIMGNHSSLGPIDPQFGGVPASGVIEEFNRAKQEVKNEPSTALLWQPIISKYHPTFIGECEKALKWANEFVKECLEDYMFKGAKTSKEIAAKVVDYLSDHDHHKNHSRHIDIVTASKIGLKVVYMHQENELKDFHNLILTIHRIYLHTFSETSALKIIENQKGHALIHNCLEHED